MTLVPAVWEDTDALKACVGTASSAAAYAPCPGFLVWGTATSAAVSNGVTACTNDPPPAARDPRARHVSRTLQNAVDGPTVCVPSQVRDVDFDERAAARSADAPPPEVQRGAGPLPEGLQGMVREADTIFLATYYHSPDAPPGWAHPCVSVRTWGRTRHPPLN